MKFTPKKKAEKGKKSATTQVKQSPGKKSQAGTTDVMTMQSLKKYLKYQKKPVKGKGSK